MKRRARLFGAAGLGVVVACGVVSALVAGGRISTGTSAWLVGELAAVAAVVVATGALAYVQCDRSWRALLVSPYSVAALTWLVLFVLRPLELYFSPDQAAQSLAQFGFGPSDLTRGVALGAAGAAAWCVGYLAALGRVERPLERIARDRPFAVDGRRALLVLAAGCALWLLLFLRQGGLGALRHSAVSVRSDQGASFYGFVGLWIVQGVALYALAADLQGPARRTRLLLAAGLAASALGAFALQIRGLAVFAAVAAVATLVALRPLRVRAAALLAVAAALGVLALGYAQQVRQYTAQHSLGSSIHLASHTPLAAMYVSDLSTYDNLVAIRELVPSSLTYLDGTTLAEIPGAVVPRTLWPGKPHGLDVRAGSTLYPGAGAAVAISLQGELYWNGGVATVLAGALLVGALFGLLARLGLRTRPGSGAFVLYAVAVAFTHAFLTRGLATMTENLIFALLGVGIAIRAMARERPQALRQRLRLSERPSA